MMNSGMAVDSGSTILANSEHDWIDGQSNASNRGIVGFPLKLYSMLQSNDSGLEEIVSFRPHGRAFGIHNQEEFCNRVIPVWFPEPMDWAVFQEQLDLYGFQRLRREGPDKGSIYHELFQRGQIQLVAEILPKGRQQSSDEPDFSKMPALPNTRRDAMMPFPDLGHPATTVFPSTPGATLLSPQSVGYPVLPRLLNYGVAPLNGASSERSLQEVLALIAQQDAGLLPQGATEMNLQE